MVTLSEKISDCTITMKSTGELILDYNGSRIVFYNFEAINNLYELLGKMIENLKVEKSKMGEECGTTE